MTTGAQRGAEADRRRPANQSQNQRCAAQNGCHADDEKSSRRRRGNQKPTHYAVALKYTPGEDDAPIVVAKRTGLHSAQIIVAKARHTHYRKQTACKEVCTEGAE